MTILWVTDADNTLWDADSVYGAAQIRLLSDVEAATGIQADRDDCLVYMREVDQALALVDHRGLKYPPSMLVVALSLRLSGVALEVATQRALHGASCACDSRKSEFVGRYSLSLESVPPLRAGVTEGLRLLRQIGASIVMATEGKKERVDKTVVVTGLQSFVDSIVAAEKTEALFSRIAKIRPGSSSWVIGDQMDRDILPALAADFRAVYFPGAFRPKWAESIPATDHVPKVSSYWAMRRNSCERS
jgi:putative hydrolase of the HAD superfamily